MRASSSIFAIAFALTAASCGEPTGIVACPLERSEAGLICANGTVRFNNVEGGLWQVVSDGEAYDPHGSLPAEFRVEGLRVTFVANPRVDQVCVHMAGPIVEILSIEAR